LKELKANHDLFWRNKMEFLPQQVIYYTAAITIVKWFGLEPVKYSAGVNGPTQDD
jgi:hypothetical protein